MVMITARARRVFRDAFDDISSDFEPNETASFARITLKDVCEASVKIEEKLAAKRRIRNMRRLKPFFEGIERYSKAIEPLCNGTPFLPWIWVSFLR